MSSAKLWKTKFSKIPKFFLAVVLIFSWIFASWPQISGFPPKIQEAQAATTFFITTGTTFVVPADWSNTNSIEVIGGGGGGRTGGAAGGAGARGGGGGGGGGYSIITNTTSLTAGATVTIQVGALGTGGATPTAGTDTFLCNATTNCASITGTAVQVGSKGGGAGTATAGGAGGVAASGVGTTRFNGGTGGTPATTAQKGGSGGGGGGGAGGTTAVGSNGANSTSPAGDDGTAGGAGGAGGAASGGTAGTAGSAGVGGPGGIGGNGGNGTVFDPTHGAGGGSGGGGGGDRTSNGGAGGTTAGLYGAGGGGGGGMGRDGATSGAGVAGRAGLIVVTYTPATLEQSAYRFFNNLDSTNVGTTLAAQDTAATLGSTGAAFRLRMLLHIGAAQLNLNVGSLKLQFAQQSGTCDTGFVGETYADVTAATVIAYNNNATPADGAALIDNVGELTHGADTIVPQTYEELNNFTNSVAAIPAVQDGKWDFALFDNGAAASTAYCLRAVKSDATVLNTYTVIPQITTAAGAPASLTFVVSTNVFPSITPGSSVFATTTLSVDTNNSTGWNVTLSRDDADTTMDLDTDATTNITDQTAWSPGAATTTAGNAVRISSFDSIQKVLAFRTMTASGTVSFISTTWWGTTDAYIDSATSLWAGFPSIAQKIGDSSVSSGGSAKLNTVLYYLDVPSTQKTGAYSGGITYTATMNP